MAANTLTIIIVIFLFILFSGIGILLILLNQRAKKKASQSQSWPKTTGTIVKSRVATESSVFGGDDAQGESQPMYLADIEYTYRVGDMVYTSKRVAFGGKSQYSKPLKAEEEAARYPEGKSVTVFYNPEKHQEAVLEQSAKGSGVLLIAGIVFLAIGVIALLVGLILL
jgi:hypothetical protein